MINPTGYREAEVKTSILLRVKFIIISLVLSISIPAYGKIELCSQTRKGPDLNTWQIIQAESVRCLLVSSCCKAEALPAFGGQLEVRRLTAALSAGKLYRQELLSVLCSKLRVNHYSVPSMTNVPSSFGTPESGVPSGPVYRLSGDTNRFYIKKVTA